MPYSSLAVIWNPAREECTCTWSKYKQDYFSNPNKHRHFAYCSNNVHANAFGQTDLAPYPAPFHLQAYSSSVEPIYSEQNFHFTFSVCFAAVRVTCAMSPKWFDVNVLSQIKYCILIGSIERESQSKLQHDSSQFSIYVARNYTSRELKSDACKRNEW